MTVNGIFLGTGGASVGCVRKTFLVHKEENREEEMFGTMHNFKSREDLTGTLEFTMAGKAIESE